MHIKRIFAAICACCLPVLALTGCNRNPEKGLEAYLQPLYDAKVFENDYASILPQTEISKLVEAHFNAPLPTGKTQKKALIFGFDGMRADALLNINTQETSAVFSMEELGGGIYLMYCGGDFGTDSEQNTSTAPGWASALTGVWANQHGVYDNYDMLNDATRTFLTRLVKNGKADNASFSASWGGHIDISEHGTGSYVNEKTYVEGNDIPVKFNHYPDGDTAVQEAVLAEIAQADCTDIIFTIYEATDAAGHDKKFTNENPSYVQATQELDAYGSELLEAIQARPTFDSEDWLYVFTSDHGGKGTNHGMQVAGCRMIFVATNKPLETWQKAAQ